ncbi:hypothetical protein Tco_1579845 [Tanacetum coccineum]
MPSAMEFITGRKALDENMPDERFYLVTWFRRVLISKENMFKAIDQTLETENEETLDMISKVAELAGHCTARGHFKDLIWDTFWVLLWNNGNL